MTETQHLCPVCAQRVNIHSSDEGTGFYLPVERRATLNEAAVKILVLAALEKQPEAHAALMFAAERVRALKDTNPFTQAEYSEIPNALETTDNKKFSFTMPKGQATCRFKERSSEGREFRITLMGYQKILIREN